MRNLNLLKSSDFSLNGSSVDGRRWLALAIDSLTPEIYFGHSSGLTITSFSGDKYYDVDLRAEGLITEIDDELLDIEFLLDQQLLFIVTKNGNLGTYDTLSHQVECVGLVNGGVESIAFSPDFDVLVIVTKLGQIMLMNREFEPIVEVPVDSEGFGQDAFVTVGWGKKETQFHGSEGKQAAFVKNQKTSPVSPLDDGKIRISWRGDGQYFAVSSIEPQFGARILRIWTRDGVHSTTSEPVNGLEQSLSWRPSGNLIASSQQTSVADNDVACSVIFFERNGLRHGEFSLPKSSVSNEQFKVVELSWNRDSSVLAVWLNSVDSAEGFTSYLQLWTMGNYHWYMKKCLTFSDKILHPLVTFRWDTEFAYVVHVLLSNGRYVQHHFGWSVCRANSNRDENATVVVVDGSQLLITSFAKAVIPPPMSGCVINLDDFCNFVSLNQNGQQGLAVLANKDLKVFKRNKNPKTEEWTVEKTFKLPNREETFYHFIWLNENTISAIRTINGKYSIQFFEFSENNNELLEKSSALLPGPVYHVTVLPKDRSVLVQLEDGRLFEVDFSGTAYPYKSNTSSTEMLLPNSCHCFDVIEISNTSYVIALNERYQLFINGKEVANNINSYCIHDKYMLCTTLSHQLHCIPLQDLTADTLNLNKQNDIRNVERGSRLVIAVANSTKVIMQMPRGNLEVIHPRPLVLTALKDHIDRLLYKDAVLMMKHHRIDMNLLYDHDPQKFMANVETFVKSIDDTLLFNLFLSDLKSEDVTQTLYLSSYKTSTRTTTTSKSIDKVTTVCLAMRETFIRLNVERRHFTSLLMTFVKRNPPELDNALQTIKDVRDSGIDNMGLVEEGLRHLLYMVDVDILTDVALGTYDFDLVIMTLEKSQKDPKEYLPFLNDLKKLDPNYRMFKIDLHLKRFQSALEHLVACGEEKFDECVQFVKSKLLFVNALDLYVKNSDEYKVICCAYAAHLAEVKKYAESALFYEQGGDYEKSMDSCKQGLCWQTLFGLAYSRKIPEDRIETLAKHVAVKLKDSKRFSEAATVFAEFAKDKENAVKCLIEGVLFEEALQKIYFWNCEEMLDAVLLPGLKSYVAKLTDSLTSRMQIFERHFQRLRIIRRTKRERFETAITKGDFDDALADVYSEVSSTVTKSTGRASAKSSVRTKQSTSKKLERKKLSLKENSAYEDLAILNELNEIVNYVDGVQAEIRPVLCCLIRFDMIADGKRVHKLLKNFTDLIESKIDEIWPSIVDLPLLPGPLHENLIGYSENCTAEELVQRLHGGTMPNSIKLEPLLFKPRLRNDIKWTVEFLV